jgi:hypothetical protein
VRAKKSYAKWRRLENLPKPSTLEKYEIKDEEIKEVMGPRGIIYKITSPSGKVYVGQTMRSFEERIRNHQRKGSECPAISRAIQKYGDGMKYEIIEENVPQEQLDEREIYWINHFNSLAPNGYNLTTGGQFYQVTQEVKDKMRETRNTLNIENNGYLGSISKLGNLFYPRVKRDGKLIIVAHGGFQTEEEAIEVLKEYTKDLENFTVVDNRTRRRDGTITKNGDYWRVVYKSTYLGRYDTEEEAHDVVKKYLNDPENFVKPKRKVGCISLQDNRWRLTHKMYNLGCYDTKEQAQEALEMYLKYPENFTKPKKRPVGHVHKRGNTWQLKYKDKHLGNYATKEEAEEARRALQSS